MYENMDMQNLPQPDGQPEHVYGTATAVIVK
jgi:hypothetical protein